MIFLKELNLQDAEKEYEYISSVPADENGFFNNCYGAPRENFETAVLQPLIQQAQGLDLPEGYVPQTHYLLWDDDTIVGWFRLRHYLCPSLVNGAGHIGYSIRKDSAEKAMPQPDFAFFCKRPNMSFLKRKSICVSIKIILLPCVLC